MQGNRSIAWLAILLVASACGRERAPSVEACTEILTRRIPAARVVEARSDAAVHAALDYEIGEWWKSRERGRLECAFAEHPGGGLRLASATLDGADLGATEVTVINADLLFADLRRAGAEAGARRD